MNEPITINVAACMGYQAKFKNYTDSFDKPPFAFPVYKDAIFTDITRERPTKPLFALGPHETAQILAKGTLTAARYKEEYGLMDDEELEELIDEMNTKTEGRKKTKQKKH